MQLKLFKKSFPLPYGGVLQTKAKNRGFRPLSTKETMHVVLRSSHARGELSFLNKKNKTKLTNFISNLSIQKGVLLVSVLNVGNHLHLHVQIPNRTLYKQWIRGLTAGIAIIVAGYKNLAKMKAVRKNFWDYRPFTRVVRGLRAFLGMQDYMEINRLESYGNERLTAKLILAWDAKDWRPPLEWASV